MAWILAAVAALVAAGVWHRRGRVPLGDLTGRVIVVTGGNSGIGKATATRLAAAGARVIITARDRPRGEAAVAAIRRAAGPTAEVEVRHLDLADLASVRTFAAGLNRDLDRLDVLVNNAGAMHSSRQTTADGFELTMGANHLGPFLLTNLLRDLLVAAAPARVVTVASVAHRQARLDLDDLMSERHYVGLQAYARSKLATILFTRELARRWSGTGVTASCLHPGTIRSGFGQDGDARGLFRVLLTIARPFFPSPEQGADTVVFLAASPAVAGRSGGYWVRRRPRRPAPQARDDALARRLWERSAVLVGLPVEDAPARGANDTVA